MQFLRRTTMHRALTATLTTLTTVSLLAAAPAIASDADGKLVADTASTATAKTKTVCTSTPARLGSIIIGSAVGIPIAMVRKSAAEVVIATKELVGDHKWAYPIVAPISVPGGIVSGVFQ